MTNNETFAVVELSDAEKDLVDGLCSRFIAELERHPARIQFSVAYYLFSSFPKKRLLPEAAAP